MKDATVEWGMPTTIEYFYSKIFSYAKGDARSKIWLFPGKGLMSHNIKALLVLFRYVFGLTLWILSFKFNTLPFLLILIFLYLIWSFRKIYLEFGEWKIALWGPFLQIISDIAVIKGFLSGLISKNA